MKPIAFAVTAMFFYAVQNVIIEKRLANISPLINLLFFYSGLIALAGAIFILRNKLGLELIMPAKSQYWLLLLGGLIFFIADMCLFTSYNKGGSAVTITTIGILIPVFTSLINFMTGGGWPNARQLLGWACAALAVILVSKK